MEILLLGNGFDLHHGLPTKYENFLHVIDFLVNHYDGKMKTISDVLGDERLLSNDKYIERYYSSYEEGYSQIELQSKRIEKLIIMAKKNCWYNFFQRTFNKDIGWIDFEKEIADTLSILKPIIFESNPYISVELDIKNQVAQYVFMLFDYFHEEADTKVPSPYTERHIKKEYCYEFPSGTGNLFVNTDKIIRDLWGQLYEFAEILKEYLLIFVDETIELLAEKRLIPKNPLFDKGRHVVSFNYTHVYEKLYSSDNVRHIHGQVDDKIVLGINADETDELEAIDTSFICFKKYHQRVKYNTDLPYLYLISSIERTKRYDNGDKLFIVGHSLDVTDQDIIIESFGLVNEIHIFYHEEKDVDMYIENLVTIFGKSGFDNLRINKKLQFLPLKNMFETNVSC